MKCTVSGSFRKHYRRICDVVSELENLGVEVLSPKRSKIVNPGDDFAVLETDGVADPKTLEERHLKAIKESDFLFVCNPLGYLGASALLEVGFALALGKRLYFLEQPQESVLSYFADGVGSPGLIIRKHVTAQK